MDLIFIYHFADRTSRAISRATAIEETGITGAYEEDFKEIEKLLKELEEALANGGPSQDQEDDYRTMINTIRFI